MSRQPPSTPVSFASRWAPLLARWRSPSLAAGASLGLALALAVGAGLLAWALSALPGRAALPPALAAAIGAFVAALPLVLALLRGRQALQRGREQSQSADALDPVTGVPSRAPFLTLAEREFARSRRYGIGGALLLVDVDRYRRLVDGHDAQAADLVLREIAASTQATLRGADALARFGHAQVAVFLAHADPLGALDVAERIRERIEQLEIIWHDQRLRATVSIGVVLMRPAHLSLQAVVEDAEAALGAARHAGGNCVRAAPVDPRRLSRPGVGPSVDDNQARGG
ncbi:MAG: GGDEF domain-containing protein [Rubrivivax sp.]|nr:GGDEF domain-containing protein [Rubrivivax sp.]MBK8526979.1 GGDEF domain-containing protein [Rubrivivax sp.]